MRTAENYVMFETKKKHSADQTVLRITRMISLKHLEGSTRMYRVHLPTHTIYKVHTFALYVTESQIQIPKQVIML